MNSSFPVFCASLSVALAFAFSHLSVSQTTNTNTLPRPKTIVLQAESYLDTQQARLVRPALIVIDQGRISSINPAVLPEDSTVVDLGEMTLMPGLIDVHTHLMLSTNDTEELIRQARSYSETDFVLVAIKNGYKTLMAGFTTIRDLDGWYFVDVTLSRNSEEDGFTLPRIVPAGHGINISGPSDYSHIFKTDEPLPHVGIADNKEELIEAVDHQAAMGAGVIKLYGTAGFTMSEYSDRPVGAQTYSDGEVAAVVTRAWEHGLKVATHAHGSEGIMASVKAGVASIEHGSILTDDIIEEMKARGTFLVPTTPIMNRASLKNPHLPPKGVAVVEQGIQSHQRAIKAGVKIAYGTDAGLYPHGQNADGFVDLVEYGMSPAQAIQTATISAAELLGVDDRGSIEVDKLADLIGVNGNPLDDVTLLQNVKFVMKNGKIYKLDARPQPVR